MNRLQPYILSFAIAVIFILAGSKIQAQDYTTLKNVDKKTKKIYTKALVEARKKEYASAIKLLQKAISRKPDFIDAYMLQSGMKYHEKKYQQSIDLLRKAIEIDDQYDDLMYLTLANTHRALDQYEDATLALEKFLAQHPNHPKARKANYLLEQSQFAAEAIKNPVPFEPILLNNAINTELSEYTPRLTIDGSQLIFTRRIGGQEDFYIADLTVDSIISRPMDELNTPYNEGVHAITADGRMIIYTACDRKLGEGSCDLFYSKIIDGKWSEEIGMTRRINSPNWEGHPSLSADGRLLFFSSTRPGGQGGKDIWVSSKSDTSGWSYPIALSDKINTSGNEETPFLHPDGETLYFRSDGHLGMGGYDIFYTKFDFDKKEWSEPKNIGYPINTKGSEGALTVSLDGKTAYFASDMAYLGNDRGKNLDIYKFDLYKIARPKPTTYVRVKIIDSQSRLPIQADYTIIDQTHQHTVDEGITTDGSFITALPAYANYSCIIEKENYLYHSEYFELDTVQNILKPYELVIELEKLESAKAARVAAEAPVAIIMNNIFFVSGSYQLMEQSDEELNTLYKTLMDNPDLRIKIIGHTDDVGSEEDNLILSERRAKAVVDYLIEKGVERGRLKYEGMGESMPIESNETPEGRKKNRRTEFMII